MRNKYKKKWDTSNKTDRFLKSWSMLSTSRTHYFDNKCRREALATVLLAPALVAGYDNDPSKFDFDRMETEQQFLLFKEDPAKFQDRVSFKKFNIDWMIRVFISNPDKFEPYIKDRKISRKCLDLVAIYRPELFELYDFLPVEDITHESWPLLIEYDTAMYTSLFFENMHKIRIKTDLRHIFASLPNLLPQLTVDNAQNSCVSAKEWILMLLWPDIENAGVTFSDEMIEWLNLEVSVEVLRGNSVATKTLSRAVNYMNDLRPIRMPVIPWDNTKSKPWNISHQNKMKYDLLQKMKKEKDERDRLSNTEVIDEHI